MMQSDIIRLIVIEESANDAEVILNSLRKARYPIRPKHVEDDEDLQEALSEHEWDLIISVPEVGDFTISQVCDMVKSSKQDIPVIVISDNFDCKVMSELFNAGVKRIIPNDSGSCLPSVVGFELSNLAERRKLQHLEQLYKESQKNNKMLLATSRDAICYVHDGMHIYANPSYQKMFNYKNMDDLEGLPIMDLVADGDQSKFKDFMREFMNDERLEERQIALEGLCSNNKKLKLTMEFSQAIYDNERCLQVTVREQSQGNKEMEKQLLQMTRRDQLTGLFNRQFFSELLDNALTKAIENHTRSRLFYISLDDFDKTKETIGVSGCDPIIKNIANVIKKLAGKSASLARFDEYVFTLLIADKDCKKCAGNEPAEKICKAIADTVTELEGQSNITTCSIGIAQIVASVAKPQDVLTDAHAACKNVIENGGNGFEIYKATAKGDQEEMKSSDIANIIESAIEDKRMSLRYQPIVNLHGDEEEPQEIYEVFLRVIDEEGNMFPTGKLFTDAENANLSTKLDRWVLQEAVKTLAEQDSSSKARLFIKLSDQAIKDDSILLFIRKLLKSSKLPGERLVFEISESITITQVTAVKNFITQLKSLNCQSALEHFGTGLNSEATLERLPVNYIKIDSVFSKDLSKDAENQEAVKNFVKLAHDSDKQVIAEAVEDANSLTVLWSSEVDFAQGHYLQEPLEDLEFDFSDEEEEEEE
ncbi:EAL domain-containing protein [Candidatus Halobeggiatoa sp. HSG11]|nr:EAL domain-containing protein [Candidatus Halobeggiatoa sp. HSG11]